MYVCWVIEESSEVQRTELVISFADLAEQLAIGAHVSHSNFAQAYRIFPCIDAEFQKLLLIGAGGTGSLSQCRTNCWILGIRAVTSSRL